MAPMDAVWLFSVDVAFACHFKATHPSSRSASGISYSNDLSKMVGDSSSYPLNNQRIDRL